MPLTRPRVAQACMACAEAKLKCDTKKPCRRCQQKQIECEYSPARVRKGAAVLVEDPQSGMFMDHPLLRHVNDSGSPGHHGGFEPTDIVGHSGFASLPQGSEQQLGDQEMTNTERDQQILLEPFQMVTPLTFAQGRINPFPKTRRKSFTPSQDPPRTRCIWAQWRLIL